VFGHSAFTLFLGYSFVTTNNFEHGCSKFIVVHPDKICIPEHGTPHFWKLLQPNGPGWGLFLFSPWLLDFLRVYLRRDIEHWHNVTSSLPNQLFWKVEDGSLRVVATDAMVFRPVEVKTVLLSKFPKMWSRCTMYRDEYFRVYYNEFLRWYAKRLLHTFNFWTRWIGSAFRRRDGMRWTQNSRQKMGWHWNCRARSLSACNARPL